MAGLIPPAFIDELLAQADIVSVIGRFVPLKQRGREYIACCPFHNEKTPSFTVSPTKQLYYCFGCGVGGSVIKFMREYQRMDFIEAVEALAGELGLEVPREGSRGSARERERFKPLREAVAKAAEFYRAQLAESTEAKNYLRSRGLDEQTVAAFGLGYAPAARGHLKRCFGATYDGKMLTEAGLLSASDDGAFYERFRDRIVFPIRDRSGRTIGFGGRLLPGRDKNVPKYLNSPETPIFQKRNTLYGVHELKSAGRFDRIIVVEGYMDVVSLAQHGVHNVVATLGTATTRVHVQQLFRITQHLVFCFDGDRAGLGAAARAAENAMPVFSDGRGITFMFLPRDEDPDSFVRAHGGDAFVTAGNDATPLAEFLFRHHGDGLDLNDPAAGALLAERLKPLIAQLPPGVFREAMYSKLAEKIGVDVERLKTLSPQKAKASQTQAARTRAPGVQTRYSVVSVAIGLLVAYPKLVEHAPAANEVRGLEVRGARLLADIIETIRTHQLTSSAAVIEQYRDSSAGESLNRLLSRPLLLSESADRETEFKQAMTQLNKKRVDQEIDRLIDSGEDPRKLQTLLEQRDKSAAL